MRITAIIAAFVLGFAGLSAAIPTPAAAQTLSASDERSVSGTRWSGRTVWSDGEIKQWTLYFREDGVLIYGYDGDTYDNGRWVQNERLVSFHTNTYFALYSGVLSGDGAGISGSMINQNGNRGTFEFRVTRR